MLESQPFPDFFLQLLGNDPPVRSMKLCCFPGEAGDVVNPWPSRWSMRMSWAQMTNLRRFRWGNAGGFERSQFCPSFFVLFRKAPNNLCSSKLGTTEKTCCGRPKSLFSKTRFDAEFHLVKWFQVVSTCFNMVHPNKWRVTGHSMEVGLWRFPVQPCSPTASREG